MRRFCGCAVAAVSAAEDANALRPLLSALGFAEVLWTESGVKALQLVQARLPDVLLADAVLPGLEGSEAAHRISRMPLCIQPAILILTPAGFPVGDAENFAVLEKPATADALSAALEALTPEYRPIPQRIRTGAAHILSAVGVPPLPGRDYLQRAIEMTWTDARMLGALTARLYPAIARETGTDRRHVERAMRHAIDVAWRKGEMEAQNRLFGDTIDAKRGCPTCGEMIAQIADILRWEGNA